MSTFFKKHFNNTLKPTFMVSLLGSLMIMKSKKHLLYCSRNQDDEEKVNTSRVLNTKFLKIEQKLDYLLDKEKFRVQIKDFPRFPKSCDSVLKKVLDDSTWTRNHMLTTEEGFTINDIIQPGLDNPDHPIGVVAVSKDSYLTFEDILIESAKIFHNRNIRLNKYENENMSILKNILSNMDEFLTKTIVDMDITTNRNIEGYMFSAKISRSDRRELARKVLEVLKLREGDIFPENGKFLSFDSQKQLLPASDQNPFFRSCGFYRDWPDGRFIYMNNGGSITLIVNEEDHIKMILKCDKESFSVKNIGNYYDMLNSLQTDLNVVYDDNLGYMTSLTSNLGSSSYFRVKMKVSKTNKEELINNFNNIANLGIKEIPNEQEDTDYELVEVTNTSSFYNFSSFLIELLNNKELLK